MGGRDVLYLKSIPWDLERSEEHRRLPSLEELTSRIQDLLLEEGYLSRTHGEKSFSFTYPISESYNGTTGIVVLETRTERGKVSMLTIYPPSGGRGELDVIYREIEERTGRKIKGRTFQIEVRCSRIKSEAE